MKTLPPLNALRAFEAAARHMSFTKASEELNVTPGAISQQIKGLEDFIGAKVFRRTRRALLLTDNGQAALPLLRDAFSKLEEASRVLSAPGDAKRLNVSVAPSIAGKWLVPRLHSFQERHPEFEVWVSADMGLADFATDDVDLAIRYGPGGYEGLIADLLMAETIVPVCSPRLLDADPPLRTPADLVHFTLLHDGSPDKDDSAPTWPMWLKAAGVEHVDGARGPKFNQSSLVIEAAVAGRGIALAKSALALADLEAGRLVAPFDRTTPSHFAYFLVHPASKQRIKAVQAFKSWLKEEALATVDSVAMTRLTEDSGRADPA
ncbi:MAG: transcriptional regulator GcvA [Alphaproteobacteria bacterium]|nr:transcriptional regulator GcvA [Alphaproteobacteria bacterium]